MSRIRIGNQTAFSAPHPIEPLEFAIAHGFDAFEWFSDKKNTGGWDEMDMDSAERTRIKQLGETHDIRYTIHAPWQANPLYPEAEGLLKRSLDFAADIGADLVNLHLYMERGPQAYVDSLRSVIDYAAQLGVRLSIENTPLTTPEDFNTTFACFKQLDINTDHVGMCLDIGHANLCQSTHNDYIRYIDELAADLPIIHLHVHENHGDHDKHLTLFTGPAQHNDTGIREFIQRMEQRHYSGAMIMEQWPQPTTLLLEAEHKLRAMLGNYGKKKQTSDANAAQQSAVTAEEPEPEPAPIPSFPEIADPFIQTIVDTHQQLTSWRQRLTWIQETLTDPEFEASPEQLATIAIYLRFLRTGEAPCQEDGRHFRPNHHARAAQHIEAVLTQRQTPENAWLLRKIYPWLPSHDTEFQHREPLTRIRDIAHRNDIPQDLKREIKHRLQNKLHRCAGPEDLKTSAEILTRITEPSSHYSSDFVEQFKIFHEELLEFFNASQLDKRLNTLAKRLDQQQNEHIIAVLALKSQTDRNDTQQLALIKHTSELRKFISTQTPLDDASLTQQLRLCDIALEEFAFALLSDMANRLTQFAEHDAWQAFLDSLIYALEHARLSQIMAQESTILLAELQRWSSDLQTNDDFQLLRLKATLERSKRFTEQYADQVLDLFPPRVQSLGRSLQVSEYAIQLFCESDIRANIIFQIAKLVQMGLDPIRTALKLPAWETIVPGSVTGKLVHVAHIEALTQQSEIVIAMVDQVTGDEEIPNQVGGLVIAHAIPYLSHLAVRARQKHVPFVMANDQKQQADLTPLQGKTIQLHATADQVEFQETTTQRKTNNQKTVKQPMTLPPVTLTKQVQLYPLSAATPAICGSKASNAALLINQAAQSNGLFQAAKGMIMPFGVMEHCLAKQSTLASKYAQLQKKITAASHQELDPLLTKMQALIQQIAVPDQIIEQLATFFGDHALLAVRSSANGEDLAQFAGAGLYDSVLGVTAKQSAAAIQQVWSSLWSRTATLSRKNAGIEHNQIHMAILFQEMIDPELAFIMHTSDPMSGTANSAWVELAVGLGDTLASAWQAGTPYRIRCDRHSYQSQLLSCANFSFALHANQSQGHFSERVNYTTVPFSTQPELIQSSGQQLAKIANYLESVFNYPQDVEGAIRNDTIYVLQTRAQQGLAS